MDVKGEAMKEFQVKLNDRENEMEKEKQAIQSRLQVEFVTSGIEPQYSPTLPRVSAGHIFLKKYLKFHFRFDKVCREHFEKSGFQSALCNTCKTRNEILNAL